MISDHLSGNTIPTVAHLTNLDTHLEPSNIAVSVIAFTSPWIDVCSPDPLIAGISKQILFMELSFAAFCGFEQIVIQGPKLHHRDSLRDKDVATGNIMQYARIIQECLDIGLRLQISILLPFSDDPAVIKKKPIVLSARDGYLEPDLDPVSSSADLLATWETWNTIRSTCKYHPRLAAGELYHLLHDDKHRLSDACGLSVTDQICSARNASSPTKQACPIKMVL